MRGRSPCTREGRRPDRQTAVDSEEWLVDSENPLLLAWLRVTKLIMAEMLFAPVLTMDGSRASVVPDPGVDHDIDDVHDQECDDRQDREENDIEKNDGIVAGHH